MRELGEGVQRLVTRSLECVGCVVSGGGGDGSSALAGSTVFTTARCPTRLLQGHANNSREGRSPKRPSLRSLGFASASMSSTGDGSASSSNWDEVVDDAPTRDIRSTLALGGNGRKKGVVVTDEAELEQLRQELEKLTPEEREQLRMLASQRVLNSFRDEDGVPLFDSLSETQKKIEDEELGIGKPTMRDKPRWLQDMLVSPYKLRRGAEKMELRRFEEDELDLELLGNGNVFSPAPVVGMMFGGRHDFSYAIYANTKQLPKLMAEKWADKEPLSVMLDQSFFHDFLCKGPGMELTLMMIPGRDLPVKDAVSAVRPAMQEALDNIHHDEKDLSDVETFLHMFNQRRMVGAPFLTRDKDDRLLLKKDTRLMFKVGPEGQTSVDAITAGKLRDQELVTVGTYFNPKVTYSFFDAFTGNNALDPHGKQCIARGILFIANGFTFRGGDPNQVLVDDPSAPALDQLKPDPWDIQESVVPSASLFTFSKPGPEANGEPGTAGQILLDGIHSRKQRRRDARRQARAAAAHAAAAAARAETETVRS